MFVKGKAGEGEGGRGATLDEHRNVPASGVDVY
jgi:hypothetical protein